MADCDANPGSEFSSEKEFENLIVRRQYFKAIQKTQQCADDDEVLMKSFDFSDNLLEKVSKPREAICDATLLTLQSQIVRQKVQALHLTAFKPEGYSEKLLNQVKGRKLGATMNACYLHLWTKLGMAFKAASTTTPPFRFMYGTFEPGAVELKKRTRKSRGKDEQSKAIEKPKVVDPSTANDSEHVTRQVQTVYSILTALFSRHGTSVCYFEFVMNPFSFAETVENMFHTSILVKEGVVTIYSDDEGIPFLKPVSGVDQQTMRVHGRYSQCIFSISYSEFKEVIKAFKIKKPLIPPRSKEDFM